ncbi:metal ABC transporter ATP-binding protein [Mycobacterium parmense]|uniref:ABC transporter ATP-binding protein n=1 Tax=Mycobacterium parmense TaxID=185642 RepID=A0A7I7YWL9_9MYCO|nr:metal ABC transporter ATP-binding protein [Mycobacterium parmense]MCV7348628.1 metal ABC transporter ATP-binding protein [Mycobacterium parmense]ORW63352.1 ABC transporter ATP-binding protein [Mycobacterium parmense]BBZ46216.1 ABC transporter ATP-binding protein [Mycobacterium parmense]
MTTSADHGTAPPIVELCAAGLGYGSRLLWQDVNLAVAPGEFLAVLGPNGCGKTSLIQVLLGLTALSSGSARVCGAPPRRRNHTIGYIPQHRGFDRDLPMRGIDLVRLGVDGHRWGIGLPSTARRRRVEAAIDAVGASRFADAPIGRCSGGEQQRLRIAQALVGNPKLLLCDEPLLSLDIRYQAEIVESIDRQRHASGIAVVLVTHEINPILKVVDRVLYLVGTRWATGTPDEVLTSATLTELYQTTVEVLRVHGRLIIVAANEKVHVDGHHDDTALAR